MSRKSTNLLIVLLCFLIAALIALGVFMTWLTDAQADLFQSKMEQIQTETTYSEENGTITIENSSEDKNKETKHQFIFVGDSRTVGMNDAILASDTADSCTFIGKVGEGYYWLVHDGIEQLEDTLAETPDATVILNLGVNDLKSINSYLSYYPELFADYPKASFYIMSVNPVSDDYEGILNKEIEAFNSQIHDAFPGQYLDCFNYLMSEGFETVDGLHYTYETYCSIHDYTVMMLKSN